MQRVRGRFGAVLWVLLVSTSGALVRADVPPPPLTSIRALPSAGCDMAELSRAVEEHSAHPLRCLRSRSRGVLKVRCTFDAAGAVTACEAKPDAGASFSDDELTCVRAELAQLKLDPKKGAVKACRAELEIRSTPQPYHRPRRHGSDGALPPIL